MHYNNATHNYRPTSGLRHYAAVLIMYKSTRNWSVSSTTNTYVGKFSVRPISFACHKFFSFYFVLLNKFYFFYL